MFKNREKFWNMLWRVKCVLPDGSTKMYGSNNIAKQFNLLFSKFQSIRCLMNAARPLCRHEVRLLQLRCEDFGFWYPRTFPIEPLPPKFHILTFHVHQIAKALAPMGISPGMKSEHAIEKFHTTLNTLEPNYKNRSDRGAKLGGMAQKAVLWHSPHIRTFKPQKKMCSNPSCRLPIAKDQGNHCTCNDA